MKRNNRKNHICCFPSHYNVNVEIYIDELDNSWGKCGGVGIYDSGSLKYGDGDDIYIQRMIYI